MHMRDAKRFNINWIFLAKREKAELLYNFISATDFPSTNI